MIGKTNPNHMNIDNTGQRDQARIFKLIKRMVTAVVALNKDLQAG